jgi:hypothetical protein
MIRHVNYDSTVELFYWNKNKSIPFQEILPTFSGVLPFSENTNNFDHLHTSGHQEGKGVSKFGTFFHHASPDSEDALFLGNSLKIASKPTTPSQGLRLTVNMLCDLLYAAGNRISPHDIAPNLSFEFKLKALNSKETLKSFEQRIKENVRESKQLENPFAFDKEVVYVKGKAPIVYEPYEALAFTLNSVSNNTRQNVKGLADLLKLA